MNPFIFNVWTFILSTFFLLQPVWAELVEEESAPIVWFIHGMILVRDDFSNEMNLLQKIYPTAEQIVLKRWEMPKGPSRSFEARWDKARLLAEKEVKQILNDIKKLSPEDQQRLVLVGHSLGGRIAVRTLAEGFRENGLKIRQLILAGAAIDFDDSDILDAVLASELTVYNLVNEKDVMLAAYKIAEKQTALGTGVLYPMKPEEFYEIALSDSPNHYGFTYLERLLQCIQTDDFSNPRIIVPQDFPQLNVTVHENEQSWKNLMIYDGWKLQEHVTGNVEEILVKNPAKVLWTAAQTLGNGKFGNNGNEKKEARILNAENLRIASGDLEKMKTAFERVRQQIQEREYLEIPNDGIMFPELKPILNYSTLGSNGFWRNLEEFNGWRIQQNRVTYEFRLLDPQNRRRAVGRKNELQKALQNVITKKTKTSNKK